MDNNNLYLWFNFTIWLLTLLIYVKRRRIWTLGFSLLLLYTLIAFASILLYNSPLSVGYFEKTITLFPFLYLYVMILLILFPILKINEDSIKYIQCPDYKYINKICIIISVSSLISIAQIIPDLRTGMVMMFIDSDFALETYRNTTSTYLGNRYFSGAIDFIGVLGTVVKGISPLFFFIYLLLPNKNKYIMAGMLLSLFVEPLSGIARCSRVLIVSPLLLYSFFFLFIKGFLDEKIRKRVYRFGIVLFVFIFLFFSAISLSRAQGDVERRNYGYLRYFGESFLVFDNYCMDAGGTREGQITFPVVSRLLGNTVYSSEELRWRFQHMKMDNSRFSTFVGDYVLDYGPETAFVFFVILFFIAMNGLCIKQGTMKFHQIILLYFMMRFGLGYFQYLYTGVGGNVVFFMLILFYVSFKCRYNKKSFLYIYKPNA